MKILIACSSSEQIPQKYFDDCKDYLYKLFEDNDLVFGGYDKGLMGLSYDAAKAHERHITGICPDVYKGDLERLECDTQLTTEQIVERTMAVIKNSDVAVFLPGGVGTMHELFTAIECKRSGEIDQELIIYNSNHFFDETLELLEKIYRENFTDESVKECYHVSESIEDTLDFINKMNQNKKQKTK